MLLVGPKLVIPQCLRGTREQGFCTKCITESPRNSLTLFLLVGTGVVLGCPMAALNIEPLW